MFKRSKLELPEILRPRSGSEPDFDSITAGAKVILGLAISLLPVPLFSVATDAFIGQKSLPETTAPNIKLELKLEINGDKIIEPKTQENKPN